MLITSIVEKETRSRQPPVGQIRHHQRDRVCFTVFCHHTQLTFCSLYNKEPEFRAWLVEERIINPETISKDQTRKEFAKFVEDFNTGAYP